MKLPKITHISVVTNRDSRFPIFLKIPLCSLFQKNEKSAADEKNHSLVEFVLIGPIIADFRCRVYWLNPTQHLCKVFSFHRFVCTEMGWKRLTGKASLGALLAYHLLFVCALLNSLSPSHYVRSPSFINQMLHPIG